MKTIVTTIGSFATGTEIADAVTDYALALARCHAVDVVDLPFIATDGTRRRIQLRIGWLTDTAAVSGPHFDDEPTEIETVLTMQHKAVQLGARRHSAVLVPAYVPPLGAREPDWDELI
ncbi:hypothetical protein [uncultured Microbacterium sp.]|uniref:hypothetical protein n=1 Tax=uncultured Microbacterium sp. TaxID=191216 RepID=UPI0028D3030F|nr:hypothetical protein [uncultured Microbacterium sp.]